MYINVRGCSEMSIIIMAARCCQRETGIDAFYYFLFEKSK